MTPEAAARAKIDDLLTRCGWAVQDYTRVDLSAAAGVALREVPLTAGRCDYLLIVNRIPVGIIEAKKEGTPLRNHIATSLSMDVEDFDYAPFRQEGGLGKAHQLFGSELPKLLDELNEVLAA